MLFSAYMYALYRDKNRITPFEFFKQIKAKALGETNADAASTTAAPTTAAPTTAAPTTPRAVTTTAAPSQSNDSGVMQAPEPLSWSNEEDRPYIVAAFIVFFFEFLLLYFAILMALRVSKNKTQLFLNLFGAVFFTLPYVLFNTIFQTEAYRSLNDSYTPPSYRSMGERSASTRSVSSRYV